MTMQVFVRDNCTVIAASVQCDVDGVPKGSHYVRIPIAIGLPNATAVQQRARRSLRSLVRPAVRDGGSAGHSMDPKQTSVACREYLVLLHPPRCISPVHKALLDFLRQPSHIHIRPWILLVLEKLP